MSLMREVAIQNERVLKEPEPRVIFESFGDNALTLTLRCFIESVDYRMAIVSELHEAINDKFNSAEVQIPFPQRDLHIDTIQPLDIRIQPDSSLK
ncbi:MAG: mechanosensitive ion channel, partial [Gammaproteobacteria bacterium]|nr:mechanosensitive ion channel [Gammaproteobacteria bacterium]